MYLIPVEQCNETIEHFTKGKGKNNPNYTCLANARMHLKHNEQVSKLLACKTPEEFASAAEYCVKHKLITVTELCEWVS